MKKFVLGLVVAAAAAFSAPAGAATVGNAGIIAALQDLSAIEHVAHGCGAGWWRGPDGVGRCRPMRRGVVRGPVVVAPPVVVGPRWCHGPYSSRRFRC